MKKQFLVLAAAATLSASSALAGAEQFYVRGNIGYAKFKNEKLKADDSLAGALFSKLQAKSGGATFALGGGYYFSDIIRADLMLEHFSNIEHKATVRDTVPAGSPVLAAGTYDVAMNLKSRATAAMINGYVNFTEISEIKFFAGFGLGMVKTTGKYNVKATNIATGATTSLASDSKVKTKNSIVYAVHFGATTKVVDNVNVDLAYSWRDLGSVKDSNIKNSNFPYRGHHVTLGIRYDI